MQDYYFGHANFLCNNFFFFFTFCRFYAGQYPHQYAAAAAMTAQHPHHLGRFNAAGMASMFPPNPMLNFPAHHSIPTTPPKQSKSKSSSQSAACPVTYGSPVVTSAAAMAAAATHHHKTSTTSLARLQQLTNGLENQAKPSRPNSALLAPGYYPQAQPAQASGQAPAHPGTPSHAAQAQAQHAMHQYSQNHIMANYAGAYPGAYLNPYMNMYHQASQASHHAAQAHPGSSANPPTHPHHQHMYPGYPLPYNYHR